MSIMQAMNRLALLCAFLCLVSLALGSPRPRTAFLDPARIPRSRYGVPKHFAVRSGHVAPLEVRLRRRGAYPASSSAKVISSTRVATISAATDGQVIVSVGPPTVPVTKETATATTASAAVSSRPATTRTSATATSTQTAAANTSSADSRTKPIVASYYPDWNTAVLSPENINYSKLDLIDFAFAVPDKNFAVEFTQDDSISTLKRLVKYGHGNHTLVRVSIGGWMGSKYFSKAVSTAANRATFVGNIAAMIDAYDLDGVDIDWEYPGTDGNPGNIVSPSDTANFLLFLKALRAKVGDQKRLSAAVTDFTFTGSDGTLKNVTDFANVLDHVLVMNYDVWGSSSAPGPNAPLSDGCSNSQQPGTNMVDAIKTWSKAGMPKSKILMGIAGYGYINWSSKTSLVHRRRRSAAGSSRGAPAERPTLRSLTAASAENRRPVTRFQRYILEAEKRRVERTGRSLAGLLSPETGLVKRQASCPNPDVDCQATTANGFASTNSTVGSKFASASDSDSGSWSPGGAAVASGDLSSYSGSQIQFVDLLSWGVLTLSPNAAGGFTGRNGYTVAWDNCSSTPYAYNAQRNVMVTYDDPRSVKMKAAYALEAGIGGTNMWELSGDYKGMLIDAARAGMGRS